VRLEIYREAAVNALAAAIPQNLGKYNSSKSWAASVSGLVSSTIPTKLEPTRKIELEFPEDGEHHDFRNAVRLHKALPDLTPLQARDPRLWTRLAHVDCWDYMRARWDVTRNGSDRNKAIRFIRDRYFVMRNESRALLRHGIARLWWNAHLTYDANRTNPYELTAVLLSRLDITQQLTERNFGRCRRVLHAFLGFLQSRQKTLLTKGEDSRRQIRQLAAHVNLTGGTTILDVLSEAQVSSILEERFGSVA
jgi:hypothetical protein